ncbi:MAG: methionine--tRNA ligase [Dehalococcoidia bacterium]|nr:methionine--tRNA ligase [Dehalococcoidia bacterium]MDW8120155.1 methionine--tRNA ligase [Chloroflexota bacterium]
MVETIFIGVAWPYANGPLHLGHIAGCYLPADIFARYQRLRGNRVLMVSGSDQHGTPITLRAEQEGLTPQQVVDKYHAQFLRDWERLGISFDLYTTTGTDNHRQVVHDLFRTLLHKGVIYPSTQHQPYCPTDRRFLPDRYVEGTCPFCRYERARGDQCERCGKPLNPQDLIGMRCRLCGQTPQIRETRHYFLRLSDFQGRLLDWVRTKESVWRPNVYNFTLRFLEGGLQDRAITRDLEWGVPVPVDDPDFRTKRIYVWFEAVIGYLSAAKEWALRRGEAEVWREFWQNPACRHYYFIGKDNIPFHTVIWPAMLMAYGDWTPEKGGAYNLPYDVPANEFLNLERQKFSTSQNWAVWVPDALERYAPDALRYCLTAIMPETADADFTWREFVRRTNDELVATYGNLVHRVVSLTVRHCAGRVPQPTSCTHEDTALQDLARATLGKVGEALGLCRFREALGHAMALAQEANRYLDQTAPWRLVREDPQRASAVLWTALLVVSALKTCMAPFLPFSSQRLHHMLGWSGRVEDAGWRVQEPVPGHPLGTPEPLFAKLDDRVAEEEVQRLLAQRRGPAG